jgi:hypothetical protein
MDKRIAGLLGAAAALSAVNGAQATTPSTTLPPAATYRDLLEPVPNAAEALKAEDARLAGTPSTDGTKVAEVVVIGHHHHHHHRRRAHHHHHHHHHHY